MFFTQKKFAANSEVPLRDKLKFNFANMCLANINWRFFLCQSHLVTNQQHQCTHMLLDKLSSFIYCIFAFLKVAVIADGSYDCRKFVHQQCLVCKHAFLLMKFCQASTVEFRPIKPRAPFTWFYLNCTQQLNRNMEENSDLNRFVVVWNYKFASISFRRLKIIINYHHFRWHEV